MSYSATVANRLNDSGFVVGVEQEDRASRVFGVPQVIAQGAEVNTWTGNVSATVRKAFTLPAGVMGAAGRLELWLDFEMTSSANLKTVEVLIGGVVVASISRTATAAERLELVVSNRTAASQVVSVRTGIGVAYLGAYVIDTSVDLAVEVRLTLASAAESINLRMYRLDVMSSE